MNYPCLKKPYPRGFLYNGEYKHGSHGICGARWITFAFAGHPRSQLSAASVPTDTTKSQDCISLMSQDSFYLRSPSYWKIRTHVSFMIAWLRNNATRRTCRASDMKRQGVDSLAGNAMINASGAMTLRGCGIVPLYIWNSFRWRETNCLYVVLQLITLYQNLTYFLDRWSSIFAEGFIM